MIGLSKADQGHAFLNIQCVIVVHVSLRLVQVGLQQEIAGYRQAEGLQLRQNVRLQTLDASRIVASLHRIVCEQLGGCNGLQDARAMLGCNGYPKSFVGMHAVKMPWSHSTPNTTTKRKGRPGKFLPCTGHHQHCCNACTGFGDGLC